MNRSFVIGLEIERKQQGNSGEGNNYSNGVTNEDAANQIYFSRTGTILQKPVMLNQHDLVNETKPVRS